MARFLRLHPTATNGDINVGDIYWYQGGVRVLIAGSAHTDDTYIGPFSLASMMLLI